jgi:hypothetical protein
LKHIKNFVEDIVIPSKGEFPIKYDLHNIFVIEDVISILEDQIESERKLNIRHFLGGYIIDFTCDSGLILSAFFDKKTLSFAVLIDGEYLEILDLNEEDNCYETIDGLMQQIAASLW